MISPVFYLSSFPISFAISKNRQMRAGAMLADPGFDGAGELRDDPEEFLGFCNGDRQFFIEHGSSRPLLMHATPESHTSIFAENFSRHQVPVGYQGHPSVCHLA